MFRLSIFLVILTVVAVGCSPTATFQPTDVPDKRTPKSEKSAQTKAPTSQTTATNPPQTRNAPTPTPEEPEPAGNRSSNPPRNPVAPAENHALNLVPASWLERGVWITNRDKAIQSAGAPDPRTLEEYLHMSETDQAGFFEAFARMMSPDFVVAIRQSPKEWQEELGLDLFSLSSTASVGTTSGPPYGPVIMMGEISDSVVTHGLLDSGYESQTYKGKEFYAIRGDFGTQLSEPLLGNSRTNRIYVDRELVAASQETASLEEFLDVLVGEATPLTGNPLVLAAIESLGETFTAAVLTRAGVFNPVDQAPLAHAKPPAWGTLSPLKIFAAGGGIKDGQPFFALSMAFDDPAAADSNIDEVKGRVENYHTIVPKRFPEAPHLKEALPNQPFNEVCSDISINSLRWTSGSTITVTCQTETNLFWSLLLNLRDLGFLVP